jgi:hypothetical protein
MDPEQEEFIPEQDQTKDADKPEDAPPAVAVTQPEHAGNGERQAAHETQRPNQHAEPRLDAPHFFLRWLRSWRQWDRDDLQVAFNGIVAATAIVGIIGLVATSCLTLSSLEETRRATHLAEQTMRIDQRAWLAFVFGETIDPIQNAYFRVAFPLTNSGKTPAHRTRFRTLPMVRESAPSLDEVNAGFAKREWQFLGAVFPSEQNRQPAVAGQMSDTDLLGYRGKTKRLFVWVELHYCDAFRQPHWIGRCGHHGLGEKNWSLCGTTTDSDTDRPISYKCD